ncbi:MAG TPA: hypothetical protein VG847_13270, partial [Chitinophagaceae bacterium]|nr:hypothetical protein [Chitinophagaceae bacterium]
EKAMLSDILRNTDPAFFRWAMKTIISWQNRVRPEGLIHIHGSADRILPYNKKMQAIKVPEGTHLMVYHQASLISKILEDCLGEKQHSGKAKNSADA